MHHKSEQGSSDDTKPESQSQKEPFGADGNRRHAVRRIGKYSIYAVPALLALASKPAAAS